MNAIDLVKAITKKLLKIDTSGREEVYVYVDLGDEHGNELALVAGIERDGQDLVLTLEPKEASNGD